MAMVQHELEGNDQKRQWDRFYSQRMRRRYPTEWVIRTIAGGNYPALRLDKTRYSQARILDMGCGDGRNLMLLCDLGFEVHATEIDARIVERVEAYVRESALPVEFKVGKNSSLPYPDQFFDYMLCSSSSYYLSEGDAWDHVKQEFARVMKPGGLLFSNFPDAKNAVVSGARKQNDGSYLITHDPHSLRNGIRFMIPDSPEDVKNLLSPQFETLSVGHLDDEYYGLRVSGFIVVARKDCS